MVNEETLRESGYFELDFDAHPYLSTSTIIYGLYVGAGPKFHTLDGETIDTTGMTDVDGKGGHAAYLTYQHYRINRVVYDWSWADDPSLDRFPNCTELWLSPKCDIDGILRSLGNKEQVPVRGAAVTSAGSNGGGSITERIRRRKCRRRNARFVECPLDGQSFLYSLDKETQLMQTVTNTIVQNTSALRMRKTSGAGKISEATSAAWIASPMH